MNIRSRFFLLCPSPVSSPPSHFVSSSLQRFSSSAAPSRQLPSRQLSSPVPPALSHANSSANFSRQLLLSSFLRRCLQHCELVPRIPSRQLFPASAFFSSFCQLRQPASSCELPPSIPPALSHELLPASPSASPFASFPAEAHPRGRYQQADHHGKRLQGRFQLCANFRTRGRESLGTTFKQQRNPMYLRQCALLPSGRRSAQLTM